MKFELEPLVNAFLHLPVARLGAGEYRPAPLVKVSPAYAGFWAPRWVGQCSPLSSTGIMRDQMPMF